MYGNARGANPAWSSGHTFLGDDQAATSGTVTIGARTYDPVIGKFLSVDSVLAPLNPLQNNGYSYAANSPVTLADPTGLDPAMHQCDHSDTAACRNYFYGGAWNDRAPVAPGKTQKSQLGAYLNSTTGVPTNLNVEAANACGWNSVCISQQPDRYAVGPGYHPTPGIADGCHSWTSCATRLGTVALGLGLIVCGVLGDAVDAVITNILDRIVATVADTTADAAAADNASYKEALGGRNSGFLNNYANKPTSEIERGIRSIQKQIDEHRDKIADPESHIEGWDNLDPRQQQALLNSKWPGDIARQQAQLDIFRGILENR